MGDNLSAKNYVGNESAYSQRSCLDFLRIRVQIHVPGNHTG